MSEFIGELIGFIVIIGICCYTGQKWADSRRFKDWFNKKQAGAGMLLLTFRDTRKQTADGRYTQGRLMQIVRSIVHQQNTTTSGDSEVANYIMNNFTINGMIDTYNDVGLDGFTSIIRQMVDMENYERRIAR